MASRYASSDQPGVPLGVINAAGYVPLGNNICWLYVLCVFASLCARLGGMPVISELGRQRPFSAV